MARALAAALAAALLVVARARAAPPVQTPRRGGTVVLTESLREPACLNAFFKRCRSADDFATDWVIGAVLPGAYRVGPGLELRRHLVSRVDVSGTPPFTLTYRIRPEARWSDGTPVSARDFVFTHRTSLSDGVEYTRYSGGADPSRRRSARCADGEVVLRSRFGGWRRLFPTCSRSTCSPAPTSARCGTSGSTPEDRPPDRKRPLPRPGLGARPCAHVRAKPALLESPADVSRPARAPVQPDEQRSGNREASARRARSRPRPPGLDRRDSGDSAACGGGVPRSRFPGPA